MSGTSVADRQRARIERRESSSEGVKSAEPPRQRRTGLAALAVALIAGGALAAGLLAVRMDSRVPVLAAAKDIAPGTLITAEHLREVGVASEGLRLIPADSASQILVGTYARVQIRKDSLIDENVLTTKDPLAADRAIVSVPLTPELTPREDLRSGDLVQVLEVSRGGAAGELSELTEGLVLDVHMGSESDLGGGSGGSLSLLVPSGAAADVVNAAAGDAAGIALLERGRSADVKLSYKE